MNHRIKKTAGGSTKNGRKEQRAFADYADSETGAVKKEWRGRTRVALVYPNTYEVGMSNLGFQSVYAILNGFDNVVCERAFLPEMTREKAKKGNNGIVTVESGRPLCDFDIVAFSISFENDFPHILTILSQAGLPLRSRDRGNSHPLLMAGGVACLLNPEPLADFVDLFLIGEGESLFTSFFDHFDKGAGKERSLKKMAVHVPGAYVPGFYRPDYHSDGTLKSFEATCDVPEKITRVFLPDLSNVPTCSAIISKQTTFDASYLVEVSRGCPHGCRFCSAGYIYRPPRFRSTELLEQCIEEGARLTDKIGLVGTAVSDLPEINKICSQVSLSDIRLSFSSLRADALTPELISVLQNSGVKTATIAPDAGSERMRRVINKGITEEHVLSATETLVAAGIPNLKLYFMIGLPWETEEDIQAIIELCKKVKGVFLETSRARKRIGKITVGMSSYVPKAFTPFQWAPMDEINRLKKKIKTVKNGLRKVANMEVSADSPRWSVIQALFSRGDRRVADLLLTAHKYENNWARTFKESQTDPGFYVLRERHRDELFPWDFIDHKIHKSFLLNEYDRARESRITPPCPMKSCTLCGVCGKK